MDWLVGGASGFDLDSTQTSAPRRSGLDRARPECIVVAIGDFVAAEFVDAGAFCVVAAAIVNWRLIAPLAALVLGLGVYVFVIDQTRLSSDELQSRKGTLLPSFVVTKVTRIEIAHRGKRIAFVRRGFDPAAHKPGQWQMVQPTATGIDKQAFDTLISELEWVEPNRRLDGITERDRTQFGLAQPWVRLSYWVQQRRHVLLIGKKEPRSLGYYAQADDNEVAYVVNAEFVSRLTMQGKDYLVKPDAMLEAGTPIELP